jgi:hypothetical protein
MRSNSAEIGKTGHFTTRVPQPKRTRPNLSAFAAGYATLRRGRRTKGEDVQFSPMAAEATVEDRQRGALLIAASLIATIRLRGEPITHSPKAVATISDSIALARMVLQRIDGER